MLYSLGNLVDSVGVDLHSAVLDFFLDEKFEGR
jgi:hypothetical protein